MINIAFSTACYGNIMQVDTTGASSQTASQDNLAYSGEFIFVCFGRSCVRFYWNKHVRSSVVKDVAEVRRLCLFWSRNDIPVQIYGGKKLLSFGCQFVAKIFFRRKVL